MTYTDLSGLMGCRKILKDPVVKALLGLQRLGAHLPVTGFATPPEETDEHPDVNTAAAAAALLTDQAETLGLAGNVVRSYLINLLAEGDFAIAAAVERTGVIGASMEQVLRADMILLWPYLTEAPSTLLGTDLFDDYRPAGRTRARPRSAWTRPWRPARRRTKPPARCWSTMCITAAACSRASRPSASTTRAA